MPEALEVATPLKMLKELPPWEPRGRSPLSSDMISFLANNNAAPLIKPYIQSSRSAPLNIENRCSYLNTVKIGNLAQNRQNGQN